MEFNDVHVPGSARKCDVVKNVSVRGNALKSFSTRQPASFEITAVGCTKENIKINVFGPSKNLIPYRIFEGSNGIFQVQFKAIDVGNYSIEVFVDGNPLPGSPFISKAYSSAQIIVNDVPQMCIVGQTSQFQVDVSQAGEGQLEISVNNGKTPNKVQVVGNNLCLVSFQPETCGPQVIDIRFNGENAPGCPIILEAVEASSCMIEVTSQDLVPVNRAAYFNVDVKGKTEANLKVSITGPNQTTLKSFIHGNYRNGYRVEYTPIEVGDHAMDITIDGQAIASSPYLVKVYDASQVKISDIVSGIVDKPVYFSIDASQSGAGNLEIIVSVDGKNVPNYVQSEGNAKFRVNFTPTKAQTHMLSVKFNGEAVPGSPRYIKVTDGSSSVVTGSCLKMTSVSQGAQFKVDTGRLENGVCKVTVAGPSTKNIPVTIHKTSNTTFDVSFKPMEVGIHHVSVTVNDIALPGSPFMCNVYDVSKVKVSKSGPGIVGKPCTFQVDASQAGEGTLELVVTTKKSSVKAEVAMRSRGLYDVTFVPQDKLSHYVNIVFNEEDVPDSPFKIEVHMPTSKGLQNISANGDGLKQGLVRSINVFYIETNGLEGEIEVKITGPNDTKVPASLSKIKHDKYRIEYQPQEIGTYKVEVIHQGSLISSKPFLVEIYDPNRVKVVEVTDCVIGQEQVFKVNHKNAGCAKLDVKVTSPLGQLLPIKLKGTLDGEGKCIEFLPTVPGKYVIATTFGGVEIPGSPVTFIAHDCGVPKVEGSGLSVAQVGCSASFQILAKGLWGKPQITVEGPESEAEVTLEEDKGVICVKYVPLETGLFDIKILWNNKEIPGSPFHPKVVNVDKVRVIGGLENIVDEQKRIPLTIGEEKRIPFDISDAGPGEPRAEIKTYSGVVPSRFVRASSHRYHLYFTPKEEGEYEIKVYFGGMLLPISPLLAFAEEVVPVPDHTRVVLRGHGLTNAKVGEEAEFIIDGSEAGPGSPGVKLSGLKAEIPVQLVSIGNNVYKVIYMPSISGTYLLSVLWSERQVKGCPLKVLVAASCDSQKVVCSGDGLRGGIVGSEIKTFIDTRKAGSGELTAHCMGPQKVTYCELIDHRDGTFTLYLKPQEGGKHILSIKYGGEHVSGSPFTLKIASAPDASKVKIYGPGIEPGVLATYQSRFICDTRGAGAGQLTIRIRGPKGAFRVEMQRESQKDRTILCKYDPNEPGDYRLEVKWSGKNVPGSPFMVMIFDTQEELNHFMQGHYQSQKIGRPPSPPVDYSTGGAQRAWRGSTVEL